MLSRGKNIRASVRPRVNVARGEPDAQDMDPDGWRIPMPLTVPPPAVAPTRSAALVIEIATKKVEYITESPAASRYWSQGIEYDSVTVPEPDARSTFKDPLDVIDLLDD